VSPKFHLTEDAKGKSLAIFYSNGDSDTISETHISFENIIKEILSGKTTDETVRELARVRETIVKKLSALSERVSVDGTTVYFDGDPLRGEVSDLIRKMFEEGRELDFKPLVNFLEKVKTNPSLKSIDDLYRWIKNGDLVIDPEGYIIGYKGVTVDENGIPVSIHSGKAFVNGEEVEGRIPNVAGTIISMPRSDVNADEFAYCSHGLHVGTYKYASEFSRGNVVLVKFSPRDVVAVPKDHNDQKIRICRYTVLSKAEGRLSEPVYKAANGTVVAGNSVKAETPTEGVRDAKGRFTKAAGATAKRDDKGRFIK
jgi:hypothetical protein